MTERHRSHSTRNFREEPATGEHSPPAVARIGAAADPRPGHRISADETHNALLGEWRAVWQRDRQRIRITRVRNISDDRTLLAVTDPDSAPDLADMRERFPELSALWDEVRRQFWARAAGDTLR